MRQADAVLIVLGLAVLEVTAAGVARSDDWTGERTYRFEATSAALASLGPEPAGAAPAVFQWPAAPNATGARLNVLVNWTGQSVQGGTATIRVTGTAPDGTPLPVQTRTLEIPSNAVAGGLGGMGFSFNATWAEVPDAVRDTRRPAAQAWDAPLEVRVTVQRPGDVPLAAYAFTASVSGSFDAYAST